MPLLAPVGVLGGLAHRPGDGGRGVFSEPRYAAVAASDAGDAKEGMGLAGRGGEVR